MKMNVTATVSHALGHWPRILPALGIQVLKNRHQPCPVCGGSDRFRFDDREGRGTWYCNQCGAGDGLKLVEKVFGVSPSDAATKVAAVTGSLPPADPAVTAAAVAETEAARKNAAALAQNLMAKTRPGTGNAYLTRKGFPDRECRMLTGTHRAGGVSWRAGDLVVPLYDDSGELVNLQLISADGRKRTLKGGQVRGTCHTLEGQNQAGKRLWIAEGYATALTVHHLTGETVMVALSSVNLLSLASLARQKHPACQIVLAADRDLSGDGQKKAAAAADACEGVVALPPVFGDWNDAFTQYGGEATRKAIYDAIRPPAESPFDTMSEAEFSAMSTSEKAMRIYEHYGEALAVDANGQLLSRYENGVWKVLPPQDFARDVAWLFQRLRAPFSSGKVASVVDTLKLIIPQQEAPSRRLIGFRNGVLDTQNGTFHPHSPSHWMRTLCDVDFTPPVDGETLETHAPAFWRWLDRAAGGRALGHWPRILPALGIQVLKNRHQPCPVCGGSDRFRFDDREGRGTWYCNQCGAGDGLKLVEKVFGVSPSDAAAKVAAVTGSLPPADPAVTAAAGAETDAARKNAAALAQTLMAKTRPGTGNAYLTRKGFPGRECRMLTGTHRAGGVSWRAGDLVVPLYDDSGELVNLQLISADGRKRTLKGGQVRGTCHTLEGQNQAGKRLWIAEGYATALTVHHLTGETVMVALSSVNLLSLASLARQKHPACQIVLAADRDLSGDGQKKAAAAADACEGVVALPPVFGDWNDAFTQYGGEATRKAIYDAIRPPAESPFDTMSEAEFSAMSTSEKAMRIYEHYGEALAVDANGQLLSRYENGVWKVLPPQDFARDVAGLFQRLRAPFSSGKVASVVDTLKLIIPQQEAPSRRLIGFRNGVLDTQNGTFHPHSPSHWMRTLCDVDFTPPVEGETLETHAPAFWRWLDRAAGGRAEKRDVILAALFMVLANRYDWQLFLEVTGPGGSGKSIMAEIATLLAGEDNATSATIETLESPRERAALTGFSLIRLPDQEKWSGDGAGLKAITGGDAVSVDPKYRDAHKGGCRDRQPAPG
ncbi:putative prophage DNA primase [Escherichia coli]|nr:putative prophage DNA primase [Escherichia coli]